MDVIPLKFQKNVEKSEILTTFQGTIFFSWLIAMLDPTFLALQVKKLTIECVGLLYFYLLTPKVFHCNFPPPIHNFNFDAIHNFKRVKVIQICQNGG